MGLRLARLRASRALALAALVCLVAGATLLTRLHGASGLPNRWTEARTGWLYRSAQMPARGVADVLREQHIDVVVDLTDEEVDAARNAEQAAAEKLGIRYLHLPVAQPKSVLIANLSRAVAEIDRAHRRGERVLVHCAYGHRRSAAALALYARLIEHEPPHIAYAEFARYAEADSNWSQGVLTFLEDNLDEIKAQVSADLADPAPG
ncbi:MAG: dual specificity protein phosphatase family protein [Myxococcota bacterium]